MNRPTDDEITRKHFERYAQVFTDSSRAAPGLTRPTDIAWNGSDQHGRYRVGDNNPVVEYEINRLYNAFRRGR